MGDAAAHAQEPEGAGDDAARAEAARVDREADAARERGDVELELHLRRRSSAILLHRRDAPHWVADNPYIHTGYRAPRPSLASALRSTVRLHNETANIWTHAAMAGFCAASFARRRWGLPRWLLPLARLYGSAARPGPFSVGPHELPIVGWGLCFSTSAAAHTLASHSKEMSSFLFALDRASIALGLISCTMAGGLLQLRQRPWARAGFVALTALSGAATIGAVLASSRPSKDLEEVDRKRRMVLAALFVQGALMLAPPLVELARTRNVRLKKVIVVYALLSVSCSLIGSAFCASAPRTLPPLHCVCARAPPPNLQPLRAPLCVLCGGMAAQTARACPRSTSPASTTTSPATRTCTSGWRSRRFLASRALGSGTGTATGRSLGWSRPERALPSIVNASPAAAVASCYRPPRRSSLSWPEQAPVGAAPVVLRWHNTPQRVLAAARALTAARARRKHSRARRRISSGLREF